MISVFSIRANLSASYFTNRQDRYFYINDAPSFTSYLVQLLQIFSGYSSALRSAPDSSSGYILDWPRQDSSQFSFASLIKTDISNFQQAMLRKTSSSAQTTQQPTIFPIIQSGVLGIREEERCLDRLFDSIEPHNLVDLTSGYFALYGPYQDQVLSSRGNYRILAASPSVSFSKLFESGVLTT